MATMLSTLRRLKKEGDCFTLLHPQDILTALRDSQPVVAFRTETDDDWNNWDFLLGHILSDQVLFNRLCEMAKKEDRNVRLYGCVKGPHCKCHARAALKHRRTPHRKS
jgi:hypothetical protein